MAAELQCRRGTAILSATANFLDGESITITLAGSVETYTFNTSLQSSFGSVLIGATLAESFANLAAALKADPAGAGVQYSVETTRGSHFIYPTNSEFWGDGSFFVGARSPGQAGRASLSESCVAASWVGVTAGRMNMTGGSDAAPVDDLIRDILAHNQLNAEVISALLRFLPEEGLQ